MDLIWISVVQVFEDVIDGKSLQTIPCSKPRSLLVFNIYRDTVLTFVQDELEIKVSCYNCDVSYRWNEKVLICWILPFPQTYVYRGTNGFIELTSFHLHVPIKQIVHFETEPAKFECPEHYIALVMYSDIQFLKAITIGKCSIKENLVC